MDNNTTRASETTTLAAVSRDSVIVELTRHRGKLARTARALGIQYGVLHRMVSDDETLQDIITSVREDLVDTAEETITKAVAAGSERASIFILSTLGRNRGYAERVEVTGKNGEDIQVTLNIGRKPIDFSNIDDGADDTIEVGSRPTESIE